METNRPTSAQSLIVVANVRGLEELALAGVSVKQLPTPLPQGFSGARRLLREFHDADVLLLSGEPRVLLNLCLARWFRPRWLFGGPRIWSLDVVLNTPRGIRRHIKAFCSRLLLSRVDHFLHHFKDLTGYHRCFGISSVRSTFVPFKVNDWEFVKDDTQANPDGDYVFTSGVSLRDYDTFMRAMAKEDLPGLLIFLGSELCQEHGTPFPPVFIAPKVRLVQDDGIQENWTAAVRKARLVVLPIMPDSIRAAGISVALIAMALGKCVIITDGATTRGVFSDEVIAAPPSDADALADILRRAWNDADLRRRHGEAARRYAEHVGDETKFNERILRLILERCVKS